MIPKKLKILGHVYTIVLHEEEQTGNSNLGTQWGKYLKLWVKKDQHPEVKEATVLHEVIEAINGALDLELEHGAICRLTAGLYQVLKENKLWITKT